MPSEKVQLINDEFYHINLRAVGNDIIFKDVNDYYRGIFSIYEFNNATPVSIRERREERKKEKEIPRGLAPGNLDMRDKFVEVLAFCFMPNHIHLLLKQLKDNGISNFMQKIGGYSGYFNKKYNRKGHLFNNFKPVHIKSDDQLNNVLTYIHCNPISLLYPHFKEKGVENIEKTKQFLEKYKWSSYQDYIGIKNFHSVTKREDILDITGGPDSCRADVDNWIIHKRDINDFYRLLE